MEPGGAQCQDKRLWAHTGTQRCHMNTRQHFCAVWGAEHWHSCLEAVDLILQSFRSCLAVALGHPALGVPAGAGVG